MRYCLSSRRCHEKQNANTNQYISFVFQTGSTPKYKDMPLPHLCKYDDDIAAVFGQHVLYVSRHLHRAYTELSEKVLSIPKFRPYKRLIDFKDLDNFSNI